ncbi:glutathione ABC transporter permease GsiD [soil metagenome]
MTLPTGPTTAGSSAPDLEPGSVATTDPDAELEVTEEEKTPFGLGAWLATAWLGLLLVAVVFADVLPIKDPNVAETLPRLSPGEQGYWLGADANGRDMLARLIYGGRNSLIIAVSAVTVGFVIGGLLGLISGYFRNWIGKVLASFFDILLAIPALVLALSLVAVLKGNPGSNEGPQLGIILILIIAIGIVSIPLLARITRGNTMAWSQREFVTAARAQGATDRRILFREILPNVLPAMMYIALLSIAIAIVAEGGLAILGASVEPPTATWGTMINIGRADLNDAPFIMFEPIIAIFLTVLSLNYLSDVVRARFDVRESAL